jgi:hypothetical protein
MPRSRSTAIQSERTRRRAPSPRPPTGSQRRAAAQAQATDDWDPVQSSWRTFREHFKEGPIRMGDTPCSSPSQRVGPATI